MRGTPRPLGAPRAGHVAVDARALHASGIGRYLREILAQWLTEPPFATLTLLGRPDVLREFLAGHPSSLTTRVVAHVGAAYSVAAQLAWLRTGAPAAAGADVVFFPHWDAPVIRFPGRGVVTVHDLTPFRPGLGFGLVRRTVAKPVLRRVARAATRVITVSHATASEVAAEFPEVTGKLCVVPNGVGARFSRPAPQAPPPCDGPYLLWVGNLKPHKNPYAALDVLARLRADGRTSLRLVVVGVRFPGVNLRALARVRGVAEAVIELGEVNDARLHTLYNGCAALLFPSRAEGFGLPVVEAMAAGAPVVAASTPAVVEAVGGAAPVFAPDDVAGMASAVAALLDEPAHRAELVARGRARARALSWRDAARATAAVLAEVGGCALREGAAPNDVPPAPPVAAPPKAALPLAAPG